MVRASILSGKSYWFYRFVVASKFYQKIKKIRVESTNQIETKTKSVYGNQAVIYSEKLLRSQLSQKVYLIPKIKLD